MTQHRPTRAGSRLRRPGVVALGTALLISMGTAAGATAGSPDDHRQVSLSGVVRPVFVDPAPVEEPGQQHDDHRGHEEHEEHEGEQQSRIDLVVDVDGRLLPLPAEDAAAYRGGDRVTVRLTVPSGSTVASALTTATLAGFSAPATSGVAQPTGTVTVEVARAGRAPTDMLTGDRLAAAVPASADDPSGAHTLTVLPVYWTAPDAATRTRLQTVATETAQYWSEQSAGRIATTPSVRAWTRIADPGTCDVTALYNRALAAHGVAPASGDDHIAVYFPRRADCGGWAGQAMVGGPVIWVNGYDRTDVLAHELGHNFGLGHANQLSCTGGGTAVALSGSCTQKEYHDRPDVMAYSDGQAPGSLNSALAEDLGLLRSVTASPTSAVTVDLAPLAAADRVRALRIPTSYGTVFVDFRPAVGRDVRHAPWAGVQVHRYETRNGIRFSQLLNMQPGVADAWFMPEGASWTVPGSGYTLTVVDVTATAARIRVVPEGVEDSSTPVTAPEPTPEPSPEPVPFSDVPPDHYFATEIGWLREQGITTGYTDGSFGATDPVARQAMAAFLYRFSRATAAAPTSARFTDVPVGHPFHPHVEWLASTGLTRGLPDGSFGAVRPVTRDAMAAFLYRLAGSPPLDAPATSRFSDVPASHPFATEIAWLAQTGITTGYADGTFGASLPVARQAMAAFLYRYDQRFGTPSP